MSDLPSDFSFAEAAMGAFSGRTEHLNPSALWVHDASDALLRQLDGLPLGVVDLVLKAAARKTGSAASDAARVAVFRSGFAGLPSGQVLSSAAADAVKDSL